jgi:hypothetical protein
MIQTNLNAIKLVKSNMNSLDLTIKKPDILNRGICQKHIIYRN